MAIEPPLLAPDRVRLYLALVPYLAERGAVAVADAAADFGVTPEQMRKMVRKLTVIGLPRQGPDDLFDIAWDLLEEEDVIELTQTVALRRAPRLTSREAAALLAGLRMVQALPGVDAAQDVQALVEKLSRGASAAPAEVTVAPAGIDSVRGVVTQALQNKVAVSFSYRAPDAEPTVRTVDPIRVHVSSGEWYLQGWCHLRRAMRTFHLDRVRDAALTNIPVTHGADAVPELFGETDAAAEGAAVTLRYDAAVAPLLADYLVSADAVTNDSGDAFVTLHVADPRTMKRLAARRGGAVEVLSPSIAREAAREWAAAALEHYRER